MVGELTPDTLKTLSQGGETIAEGIRRIGGNPDKVAGAARRRGELAAYLELHVEQGGVLDSKKIDIGIVEGIVGVRRWEVRVEGFANHAGSTPMNMRRDALAAASHFVIAVERIVRSMPGNQVGTVGRIRVEPGAVNVIPGLAEMSMQLRDLDEKKIALLFEMIQKEAAAIGERTGTKFTFSLFDPGSTPAMSDPGVRKVIGEAAEELGLSTFSMQSGAGHDAQDIARIAPMGMIFVPSVGGISHSPREFTKPEDCANGANVLLRTLLKIDK